MDPDLEYSCSRASRTSSQFSEEPSPATVTYPSVSPHGDEVDVLLESVDAVDAISEAANQPTKALDGMFSAAAEDDAAMEDDDGAIEFSAL